MSLFHYYNQLMMLTKGDILASAPEKAVDNRMALIRQLFPEATAAESQKIFEITEFEDLRRNIAEKLSPMSDETIHDITMHAAHQLKLQRLNAKVREAHQRALPAPTTAPEPTQDSDDLNWQPF